MDSEERSRRESKRYQRLRELDHGLFDRACRIGDVVTIDLVPAVGRALATKTAYRVESAVIALVLDALDAKERAQEGTVRDG